MKTANRLSISVLVLTLLVFLAAPVSAQRNGFEPSSPWRARPDWTSGSASIPSAEYRSPVPDSGSGLNSPIAPRGVYRPVAKGTVSVARLKNAPPPKAIREMQKGAEALAEGDREACIQHYQRAIEIHPSYIEAYNNLGVQYLRVGRTEEALAALEKAVELDPGSAEPHLNLSIALHSIGQLEAATYQAERAVELAPTSPAANLGLGLVLTASGKNLDEALRRLQMAADEHPGAALAAADVLLQLDRPKEAQVALRSFLNRSPESIK